MIGIIQWKILGSILNKGAVNTIMNPVLPTAGPLWKHTVFSGRKPSFPLAFKYFLYKKGSIVGAEFILD